jgi:hypothetical protein
MKNFVQNKSLLATSADVSPSSTQLTLTLAGNEHKTVDNRASGMAVFAQCEHQNLQQYE